jgi:hypothetical protein
LELKVKIGIVKIKIMKFEFAGNLPKKLS